MLYVAADECKRFVTENCYQTTKFFMHTSIALLILLLICIWKAYRIKKELNKLKGEEKSTKKN